MPIPQVELALSDRASTEHTVALEAALADSRQLAESLRQAAAAAAAAAAGQLAGKQKEADDVAAALAVTRDQLAAQVRLVSIRMVGV